jgi:hypothetical protein
MHEDNPHRIRRRVKLPGGRQIEVVYLDSAPKRLNEAPSHLTRPATGTPVDQRSARTSGGTPDDPQTVRKSGTPVDQRPARTSRGTPNDPQTARADSNARVDPRPIRASNDTPVTPRPWTGDSPSTSPGEALHVCPRCAGELVHPLDWAEESPGRWRILMRCPDCDALREGVFGQALVERLDEELDKATGALLGDLRQLTHANMVEEIEVFAQALELDLIGPSDF